MGKCILEMPLKRCFNLYTSRKTHWKFNSTVLQIKCIYVMAIWLVKCQILTVTMSSVSECIHLASHLVSQSISLSINQSINQSNAESNVYNLCVFWQNNAVNRAHRRRYCSNTCVYLELLGFMNILHETQHVYFTNSYV